MIYINLTIRNPWSDLFVPIRSFSGLLFKHKAWEVEIYRSDTIVEAETKLSFSEDHAGLMIGIGLASYTLRAQFYDTRHWNYEKKQWETYD
jgi:hypothetical protein